MIPKRKNRFRYRISLLLLSMLAVVMSSETGAFAQTSVEAIRQTLPRMVKIFGAGGIQKLHAYGTGFLVTADGHIATVWSHVLDSDNVTVVLDNGRRFEAKVVGAEPQLDLAVLKIQSDDLDLPYFDLKQAATAGPGTRVLGFSNMFKVATGDEPVSVLHGVVAAKTKLSARRGSFDVPYDGPAYIVDAITNNSGAGGGVITTRDGKLLGMIGKELRNNDSNTWVNYAVPVTELREVIGQIISGDYTARERKPDEDENPNRYNPLDFGLVMLPNVLFRTPAYIHAVLPNSAAGTAGLRSDDLVLFINDELIQSNRMLESKMGLLEAGDTLKLIVRRGNGLVSVKISVPRKSESSSGTP